MYIRNAVLLAMAFVLLPEFGFVVLPSLDAFAVEKVAFSNMAVNPIGILVSPEDVTIIEGVQFSNLSYPRLFAMGQGRSFVVWRTGELDRNISIALVDAARSVVWRSEIEGSGEVFSVIEYGDGSVAVWHGNGDKVGVSLFSKDGKLSLGLRPGSGRVVGVSPKHNLVMFSGPIKNGEPTRVKRIESLDTIIVKSRIVDFEFVEAPYLFNEIPEGAFIVYADDDKFIVAIRSNEDNIELIAYDLNTASKKWTKLYIGNSVSVKFQYFNSGGNSVISVECGVFKELLNSNTGISVASPVQVDTHYFAPIKDGFVALTLTKDVDGATGLRCWSLDFLDEKYSKLLSFGFPIGSRPTGLNVFGEYACVSGLKIPGGSSLGTGFFGPLSGANNDPRIVFLQGMWNVAEIDSQSLSLVGFYNDNLVVGSLDLEAFRNGKGGEELEW